MAISFVQSAVLGGSQTVSLDGVTAGNIVVVSVTAHTSGGTWTVSDGTGDLTALTRVVGPYGIATQLFYTLNARGGNRTYTVSREEIATSVCAMEFSCSGSASLKEENGASADGSSSISSGNVSASGHCLVLGAHISSGTGNWSNLQIAGTAADGYKSYLDSPSWSPTWYRIGSSGISGAATATTASAGSWACAVLAIEEGGGIEETILTAESGSYAVTGSAAGLKRGSAVVAAAGAYTLSGADAGLRKGRRIVAEARAFSITGTDAGFRRAYRLSAEPGSFAQAGTPVSLEYNRRMAAEAASFALAGTDAALRKGTGLVAEAGSFALTGQDVAFRRDYAIRAESGSYVAIGNAAALRAARRLSAEGSSYALSGSPAGLHRGMRVSAGVGVLALTGLAASLRQFRLIPAATGVYVLMGQDAGLIYYPLETYKLARVSIVGKSASAKAKTKSPSIDFAPL